jgi:hypothetical protein
VEKGRDGKNRRVDKIKQNRRGDKYKGIKEHYRNLKKL